MSAAKKIFCILLVLLVFLTVAFTFYNSSLPPQESSEQSDTVGGIIAEIIPPETQVGGFIQKYLRKIAHFTEYGLLGIEFALLLVFFSKKKFSFFIKGFFFSGTVALLDETIQIFSKRGPSVEDIWIDIGGYIFFSVITVFVSLVILLIALVVKRIKYR